MIDAFHTQKIQRPDDVIRRSLFSGMSDTPETLFGSTLEDTLKFLRRMPHFRGIEPDPNDFFTERKSLLQCLEGIIFAKVT